MNKQQLASKIWESANKMRSKIEANEYKDYILGFMFYKFLSDKEVQYLKDLGYTEDDMDTVNEDDAEIKMNVKQNIGYFISYENLFSTWLKKGSDFNVANVRDALSAFSRNIDISHKSVFYGIFDTLQTGLSKLGDSAGTQTKAISDLIYLIKDIPMDGRQDYDVLGFIYEYLISNFAANAGKKAGEFYTPHEVSLLMSEIVAEHLKDRDEIKIYDSTSGSGSLLINIGRSVSKHMGSGEKIKYYAQELKENTYNLTRMNLIMRGILPDNIVTRNGDTLEEDWPYFDESDPVETYEPLYVDAVVSNPPYSQNWYPDDKEADPRFKEYGLAPKGKADYAFLLHDLYHIKPDGIMTIVLPHGVLFRGGEEGEIRRKLIENNKIDTIIGLPANIFFGTGIPTIIMVLKQKRSNTDVLIIDASKGFEKEGKNNKLRASDIRRIADTVVSRQSIEKYSRLVSREEIRQNDYNLNIPRYVDSSEKAEYWDIYASMFGGIPASELSELDEYWNELDGLKEALFDNASEEYATVKSGEISKIIQDNTSVKNYIKSFADTFCGFDDFMKSELIDGMSVLNISKEEKRLSDEIFRRFENLALVDKYNAFQVLDDQWVHIAIDLEIIQTEGMQAIKQVDPLMVVKKKGNREVEVQDGWVGHILPFELVQQLLLSDELGMINQKETRLSESSSEYEELLESLSEEDKEAEFINEDKSAFVASEVRKALKAKELDTGVLEVLKQSDYLNAEEKKLKKEIKTAEEDLLIKTKETIENLSDDEMLVLLEKKWIKPLLNKLYELPEAVIKELIDKIEIIVKKYDTTFSDIDAEIRDTEKKLAVMIDSLTGNSADMLGLAELKKLLGGE